MTCLMLDDEPLALKVLENYVSRVDWLQSKGYFTDPTLAQKVLASETVDLLFLDIQMPDVNGLHFFEGLHQKPMVIFSTAFRDFAVEGFELNAVDYIVKPYEFERFEKAIHKAADYLALKNKATSAQHIFVRSTYSTIKINLEELYLIETCDDYLKLHITTNPRPIYTLMTLKNMEQRLPADRFIRVHRSFIVALQHVEGLRKKNLTVQQQEIPVGITYWKAVKRYFEG